MQERARVLSSAGRRELGAVLRFVGNLVTGPDAPLDSVDPATIEIGEPVVVCFAPEVDGTALPRWVRP
jgi:hypothetical protein